MIPDLRYTYATNSEAKKKDTQATMYHGLSIVINILQHPF